MITIVVVLFIIFAVAVFSIQNAKPVKISFFLWGFDASLAIVIFLSVLAGTIIGAGIVYAGFLKRSARKKEKPSGL